VVSSILGTSQRFAQTLGRCDKPQWRLHWRPVNVFCKIISFLKRKYTLCRTFEMTHVDMHFGMESEINLRYFDKEKILWKRLYLTRLHLTSTEQCKVTLRKGPGRQTHILAQEHVTARDCYIKGAEKNWTTTRLSTYLWFIVLLLMIYFSNYFIHKIENIRLRRADFDFKNWPQGKVCILGGLKVKEGIKKGLKSYTNTESNDGLKL
jgi:hypothetical protein